MSNRDDINIGVNIEGGPGRAELDALLKRVRQLGSDAVRSGGQVDKSLVQNAKNARQLASELQQADKIQQHMAQSLAATRAAQARATTAVSNSNTARVASVASPALANNKIDQGTANIALTNARAQAVAREQLNKDLIAEGKLRRINDQISQEAANRELRSIAMREQAAQRAANAQAASQRQAQQLGRAEQQAYAEQANRDRNAQFGGDPAQLSSTRYALYDVAQTATIVGTAIAGIGTASIVSAAQFESSFSDVQRAAVLTGDQIGEVYGQLVDLSTAVPTSFKDISSIATLGAQMGIASQDLDGFSETVAKFSATTNATVDATATAFGRISNLLDVNPQDFDKLGAAIYEVGIKSVATETEILSMSQQIAGAAATYKISAQDVVGLSAAFSSLAIAPEAARGSVTRIFSKINEAVRKGGTDLDSYAQILGKTSDQAADLFKQDPTQFFEELVTGLSKAKDLGQALDSIDAKDVRDKNLFQRLAGNPQLVIDSIDTANSAYEKGTALNDGYAVTVATLSSKFAIFVNNLKAVAAAAGTPLLAPLSATLDVVTKFLQQLAGAKFILGFIAVLTLLVGGFILLKGAQAAAIAGLIAIRTAIAGLSASATGTSISLRGLVIELQATARAAGLGALGISATGTAAGATTGRVAALRGALIGLATSAAPLAAFAAVMALVAAEVNSAHKAFDSDSDQGLKYVGSYAGLADAAKADADAMDKTSESYDASNKILRVYKSAAKDAGDANDTSAQQAKNLASVLGTDLPAGSDKAVEAAQAQTLAWGDTTTAYIKSQITQNGALQKSAASSDNFVKYFKEIGATQKGVIDAAAANGQQGVRDYFAKLDAQAAASGKKLDETLYKTRIDFKNGDINNSFEVNDVQLGIDAMSEALGGFSDEIESANNLSSIFGDTNKEVSAKAQAAAQGVADVGDSADGASGQVKSLSDQMDGLFSTINQGSDFGAAVQALFSGIYDGGAAFNYLDEAGRTNLSNLAAAMSATATYAESTGASVTDSIAALFVQLQGQGVDTASLLQLLASQPYEFTADLDISAVQAKLAAIGKGVSGGISSASKGPTTREDLLARAAGVTSTNQLSNATSNLTGQLGQLATTAPRASKSLGGGGGGGNSVADTAKEAAEEVYTLTDYVDDLGSILDKSYEFRFGLGEAQNDLNKQWRDIRDAQQQSNDKIKDQITDIKDARRTLAGYRADLQGLQANLSQDKYFLKVANRFGDNLRAQAITADIAKDNSDINDKKAEISAAKHDINSKKNELASLRVKKAIADQDEELGNLVKSYNDLITQYANSGLSSDQLKVKVDALRKQFISQATQAGYSKAEILKYAGAFDDMRVAIQKLPKKITVNTYSNTSPAERALKEFLKKANKSVATPKVGNAGTTSQAGSAGVAAGNNFGAQFSRAALNTIQQQFMTNKALENYGKGVLKSYGNDVNSQFGKAKGGFAGERFASGGFVPGMKPQDRTKDNVLGYMASGGIVGLQGGEPISTNAARTKYGDAMFDQINDLKFKPQVISQTTINAMSGGEVIAHLSAEDRALLRAALNRPATAKVDFVSVAEAANKGNKQLTFGG